MFSLESYNAFRRGAACVRRSDRGVLKLTGADRTTWLQGLLTNEVLGIPAVPGSPVRVRSYGAWLTPQGRMITDLWVIPCDDYLLLDVPASLAASLRNRLDALIFAEDVQVDDASGRSGVIEVYGPDVSLAASRMTGVAAAGETPDARFDVFAAAPDSTLAVPASVAYLPAPLIAAFIEMNRQLGAAEADLDTLDVIRIEAGIPKFLADMDEHTIPLEAGIEDRAISFTKGCYVGQEVIVRVTTRGQGRVAKKLVGLRLGLAGQVGQAGLLPDMIGLSIGAGDREIGRVTSAAHSPLVGRDIALGYVHRDFAAPGTELRVGNRPATVVDRPFTSVE